MGQLLSLVQDGNLLEAGFQNSSNTFQTISTTINNQSIPDGANNAVLTTNADKISDYSNDLFGPTKQLTEIKPPKNASILTQGLNNQDGNGELFSFSLFGTVFYPFKGFTLSTLGSWLGPLSSLAMIVGCVLPYVPQYVTIYKAQSCRGFSTFVCLTLLLANILRIAFWFGHRFELPYLIQSYIMILVQVLLLELCIRVKFKNLVRASFRRRVFLLFNPRYFWRWPDLISHLVFLFIITALISGIVYYLIDNVLFIESVGCCALVIESMLGLPQAIRNYRKRSVEGMSLIMVLMWLGGDVFKTGYAIVNQAPFQFMLCGLIQISIDVVILLQVCLFKQNAPMKVGGAMDMMEL